MTLPDWKSLTLDEARKLPEPGRGKAIYFLWGVPSYGDDELLYIGASTNVSERVARQAQFRDFGHLSMSESTRAKPRIPFRYATALPFETVTEMADAEKVLIKRWWPPWNDRCDDGDQVWSELVARERAEKR